ncbi:MAG: copper resistance protein CopC [Vulcanimicrobiaceae bacterium]|jgi:methionine-rich copper-binding protein CopC
MTITRAVASIAVAALLFAPICVRAHAFLDHSDPAVGSTIPTSPAVIHLWFTQQLEPVFTSVTVTDKSGATVNDGPAEIDPGNKFELDVKMKPLDPGTYKVEWHALSVDTHRTQGDFSFHVGKG